MKGVIMQAILPAVRFGVNVKAEAVRHECLSILSALTRRLSNHARFKDLTILLNDDPESDFFQNICHIQVHQQPVILLIHTETSKIHQFIFFTSRFIDVFERFLNCQLTSLTAISPHPHSLHSFFLQSQMI
jgi:hypothetical protein